MARELIVTFTATFKTKIIVVDDDGIADALTDIDIPENDACKYVGDSFEVESVEDENGDDVEWEEDVVDGDEDDSVQPV